MMEIIGINVNFGVKFLTAIQGNMNDQDERMCGSKPPQATS